MFASTSSWQSSRYPPFPEFHSAQTNESRERYAGYPQHREKYWKCRMSRLLVSNAPSVMGLRSKSGHSLHIGERGRHSPPAFNMFKNDSLRGDLDRTIYFWYGGQTYWGASGAFDLITYSIFAICHNTSDNDEWVYGLPLYGHER